jgi:hypothetical protein
MSWFDVDHKGLAKLLERRGKAWALAELIQNSWDANGTTRVDVTLAPVPNLPYAELIVVDDSPGGFANLSHGYTLFAESEKKGDPEKRGRWNLGEKLVVSCCKHAKIESTTGTVEFLEDETRAEYPRRKLERGTKFSGLMRLTRDEYEEICRKAMTFLVPAGIVTTINGSIISPRQSLQTFKVELPTEYADGAGILRPTRRITTVEIYEPIPGAPASIFELGLPIVETGNKWDINICQKVPLGSDRDNVSPSFLRHIHTAVVANCIDKLDSNDTSQTWVTGAAADSHLPQEVREAWWVKNFGKKAALVDERDPGAGVSVVADGGTLVGKGAINPITRRLLLNEGGAKRAGDIPKYKTPKPYSVDGEPAQPAPMTPAMHVFAAFAKALALRLIDKEIDVRFVETLNPGIAACYGRTMGSLDFSVKALGGSRYFNGPLRADQLDLLIHEIGHEEGDHYEREYLDALTALGAKATFLALTEPMFFDLTAYSDEADAA